MFSTLVVSRKRYPRAIRLDWSAQGLSIRRSCLNLLVTLLWLTWWCSWRLGRCRPPPSVFTVAWQRKRIVASEWASCKATTSRLTVMDSRSLWCITTGVWSDTKRVKTLAFHSMKRLLLKCEHDVFTKEYWTIWRIGDPFWFLWQYQIELSSA